MSGGDDLVGTVRDRRRVTDVPGRGAAPGDAALGLAGQTFLA